MFLIIFLSICGLCFFLKGFFLTRRELGIKSTPFYPSNLKSNAFPNLFDRLSIIVDQRKNRKKNDHIELVLNDFLIKPFKDNKSSEIFNSCKNNHNEESTELCSNERKKTTRIYFFIIDALRLDFMIEQSFDDPKESKINFWQNNSNSPYNRFVNLHNLLRFNSSQSILYGFRAEPPTVTSQRLKGITTGTLPTFIDISSNFNSKEVYEDNIIDIINTYISSHMINSNNVCLGDDTWGSLYPSQFKTKYLFDSFNTFDLDTVDNGILKHIWEEMALNIKTTNSSNHQLWNIFVAHFLGVDHVGHSYNAFHPFMKDKLILMDNVLQKVVENLPDDSLLFVFGDHGMTDEGEHGGATKEETDSGLFIYSKKPLFEIIENKVINDDCDNCEMLYLDNNNQYKYKKINEIRRNPRVISQIDLAPTISLLLNIPLPFSSIGMLLPELLFNDNDLNSADSFLINALQIWGYLVEYNNLYDNVKLSTNKESINNNYNNQSNYIGNNNFSLVTSLSINHQYYYLEKLLVEAINDHMNLLNNNDTNNKNLSKFEINRNLAKVNEKYINFITRVQSFARHQWTEFNLILIISGLVIMSLSLFYSLYVYLSLINFSINNWIGIITKSPTMFLTPLVCLFQVVSSFSNSFIIEEHWLLLFVIQSANLTLFFQLLFGYKDKLLMKDIALNILIAIIPRIVMGFQSENSHVLFQNFRTTDVKVCIALLLLLAVIAKFNILEQINACYKNDTHRINNNYCSNIFRMSAIIMEGFVGLYWILKYELYLIIDISLYQWIGEYIEYKTIFVVLPRAVIVCFLFSTILSMIITKALLPLNFFVLKFIIILGLFSGPVEYLFLLLSIVQLYVYLNLNYKCIVSNKIENKLNENYTNYYIFGVNMVLYVTAMARFLFYASSHRMDFGKLQLGVAFIGNDVFDFNYGGLCLALNTFGYEILSLYVLFIIFDIITNINKAKFIIGVFDNNKLRKEFIMISFIYRLSILFFSCFSAAIHRYHLMVWAIFAPKVAFESFLWIILSTILLFNTCTFF